MAVTPRRGGPSYINSQSSDDGRLFAPVFERNMPPLIAALVPWLKDRAGMVLEIGSGTGQHAAALELAFPNIAMQPSDPVAAHRASCAAWRAHLRLPARDALEIDAAGSWSQTHPGPFTAITSFNVIHIAPFAVAQGIVAGARETLAPGGLLVFYGPFKEGGAHTGDGNAAFDARLRAENPDWGIRDVSDIEALASAAGLTRVGFEMMPVNNRLLVFKQ